MFSPQVQWHGLPLHGFRIWYDWFGFACIPVTNWFDIFFKPSQNELLQSVEGLSQLANFFFFSFSKCFFKPWWQFHVDFFLNVSWRKTFLTSSWFSGQSYWKQSRFFSFSWFMCFSLKFLGLSNERVGVGIEIEIGVRVGTGIDYTSIVTGIDFKTDLPFYSFPPWENLGWNNVDSWRKWHP